MIHRLVQNPFYYGEMRVKGELFPHRHEKLTTRETFKACEAVRMGWEKKPFKYAGKEFLFRGMLKCAVTGNMVIADTKKRINTKGEELEWTYLITNNPKDPKKKMWVREDKVIEQLEEILKNLKIKDEKILKETMDYLTIINDGKKHEFNQEVAALKEEHSKNQTKLDNMIDLVSEGVLTKEDFLRKQEQIKDRQYELTQLIASYDDVDDKLSKKLVSLIKLTQNAYETFKSSKIDEKRELLKLMFSNFFLNGLKLEFTWARPFDELAKLTNCPTWRE